MFFCASCTPQLTAAPSTNTTHPPSTQPDTQRPRLSAGSLDPALDPADAYDATAAALSLGWLPDRGRECIRSGPNRGFCAGPRRVPRPHGVPAALAETLGLGQHTSSSRLLLAPPPRAWVEQAKLIDGGEWVWPVDPTRFVRGLGDIRVAIRRRREMAKAHPDPAIVHPAHHEHEGIDLAVPVGTPIRAAQGGLVVYSDNGIRGYGNLVTLLHPDGSVTLYAHCRATFVFPGQAVSAGEVIAEVGMTGFTRGPHLHFEYRVAGMPRDAQRHLPKRQRSRRGRAMARDSRGHHQRQAAHGGSTRPSSI